MTEQSNVIPASLIKVLKSKRVIPLVGAGVSRSITSIEGTTIFPTWPKLLENAANLLSEELKHDDAHLVSIFLKRDDYQSAAKHAYEGLKGPNWTSFFKRTFDPDLSIISSESLSLAQAVWGLNNQIITLNYDRVLQHSHSSPAQVSTIDNNSISELADFKKGTSDKPVVWHLHGKIDNSAELVLTPDSYANLYESTQTAALEALKTVMDNQCLLFIGCSLDDAEILHQMNKRECIFSGNVGPHFALVHKDSISGVKAKLANVNIQIIPFEDFGSPLISIIKELSNHVDIKKK
ncbi:MAG: hypothetical protein ACI88H_003113 [Cocleimonas sp.]|jgi:hypothetical protein